MSYRKLVATDANRIHEIQSLIFSQMREQRWISNWSLESIQTELSLGHAMGWEQGTQLVAYLFCRPGLDKVEIMNVGVDPKLWRRGIANQIMTTWMESLPAGTAIWLEVHAENFSARKLYEKLGFSRVGLRPRYYSDGGDALLFSCSR